MGALTRGQRQTCGNGIFDTKDNLESQYAEHALYELFKQNQFQHIVSTTLMVVLYQECYS
ncbi:strawberry notch C-terminal domain-containing protein [Nostoc sp.]|uniref:strawberry notch C-terminal domain-containing protein n=1 Tax=Nostoc sp. TaxID=1180 RepID=UPI003FA5B49C